MKAFVTALLLIVGGASTSATAQSPVAQELMSISVNSSFDYSKAGRERLVTLLLTYCQEFLSALPTNTPNEAAWLANEMNTSDINKVGRVVATREYARYSLQSTFQGCVNATTKLSREQRQRGSQDISRSEAALLVSLAANFNDAADIVTLAKRLGMSVEQFQLDFLHAVRRSLLFASLRTLEGK